MRLNFLLFLFCIAFIAKSQSVKDQEILIQARKIAAKVIEEDPELIDERNKRLKRALIQLQNSKKDWKLLNKN